MRLRIVALACLVTSAVSAHALTLERASVDAIAVDETGADPFRIRARLGELPQGDLAQLPMTVQFGDAVAEIPAGALRRRKGAVAWRSGAPGVRRVTIRVRKSTLEVSGGGVEVGELAGPIRLAVTLGEDEACGMVSWVVERRVGGGRNKRGARKIADGKPADCPRQPPNRTDPVPPTVQITNPTGFDGISFASPTITVGGIAFDDKELTGLSWENDRGGGASVLPVEEWTIADIPLQPGDNRITVSATDSGDNVTTDVLVATYNTNGVIFDGVPVADPDGTFVGEAAEVVVRQAIVSNPDIDPASVRLVRITGVQKVPVGSMGDDGNLQQGDEIQADGIFTGKLELGSVHTGLHRYRVSARTLSHPEDVAWSPALAFPVMDHVTQEQLDAAIALANDARTLLASAAAQGIAAGGALAQVVDLATQRGATAAGRSETGLGAWWVTSGGLLGGVLAYDQTALRAGPAATPPAAGRVRGAAPSAPAAPLARRPVTVEPGPEPRVLRAPAPAVGPAATTVAIGSRRVAILAPYFGDAEADDVATLLEGQQCPPYGVESYTGADAGAEKWKTLDRYGLVLIASHGDTFFHDVVHVYREEWGWGSAGSQAVMATGTVLSADNLATWERDLRLGRMAVLPDGVAAVLPAFITAYNVRFPSSVVYAGTCRSSFNPTLSSAFFGRGASTFYGYDGYVATDFARDRGIDLFTRLVGGQTTGDAFTPGLSDGGTPGATFTMAGRGDVSVTGTDIVNASFETESGLAASVPGWIVEGDGRVIGGLGTTTPTDGRRTGLISTGLGFTDASGSVSQPICLPALPAGATTLRLSWDWNFFSEEFLEYCGSQFQDSFSVSFGATELFATRIDDLCSQVTSVDVDFDRGDVHATGWRTTTVDITPLAGTTGTLTFAAHDVGDSIYDSAILIDHIVISAE